MRSPTHGEDTTREGEFRSPRAGPVVLAGGAAQSCMYGGAEKPLGSAVSSGNGIAGAREHACSIPHDGHVHAELLMGRA